MIVPCPCGKTWRISEKEVRTGAEIPCKACGRPLLMPPDPPPENKSKRERDLEARAQALHDELASRHESARSDGTDLSHAIARIAELDEAETKLWRLLGDYGKELADARNRSASLEAEREQLLLELADSRFKVEELETRAPPRAATEALEKRVQAEEAQRREMEALMEARNARLLELKKQIADRDQTVADRDRDVAEAKSEVGKLRATIRTLRARNRELKEKFERLCDCEGQIRKALDSVALGRSALRDVERQLAGFHLRIGDVRENPGSATNGGDSPADLPPPDAEIATVEARPEAS